METKLCWGELVTCMSEHFPLVKTTEKHFEKRNEACENYIGLEWGIGEGVGAEPSLMEVGKRGARDTNLETKLRGGDWPHTRANAFL